MYHIELLERYSNNDNHMVGGLHEIIDSVYTGISAFKETAQGGIDRYVDKDFYKNIVYKKKMIVFQRVLRDFGSL
jgi:hypothetical protein